MSYTGSRLSYTIGLAVVVALVASTVVFVAPAASAAPHESVGEVLAECEWEGTVAVTDPDTGSSYPGGMDDNRSHNFYSFRGLYLECMALDPVLDGNYDVFLEVTTDDYLHRGIGENCTEGGSIAVDDDGDGVPEEVHSGVLDADAVTANTNDLDGKVHFVRLGTVVLADGPLWRAGIDESARPEYWFQATLRMVPYDPIACHDDDEYNSAYGWYLDGNGEIYHGTSWHHPDE